MYIACGYTDLRRGIDGLAKKHEYTLDELPENVPVEVVEHHLPEEELVCPECGSTMTEIGKEVRRRLKLVPAKAVVVEDRYYTYACRKCEKENTETTMVKAPREPNFIPGSFATPEAAAYLMAQKFVMGSPLYRQEQELKRQGIPLSRQTMSGPSFCSTTSRDGPPAIRRHS